MIIIIKGRQRKYKTTIATGLAFDKVQKSEYKTSDIYSNFHLFKPLLPGETLNLPDGYDKKLAKHCINENVRELEEYHYMTSKQIRELMKKIISSGLEKLMLLIDEIDRVFPQRYWQNKDQTEALLGLWQDEKLDITVIGTAHLGLSVDNTIRESMQIEVITKDLINPDQVLFRELNALQLVKPYHVMNNVKLIQRLFCTKEPVK